MAEPPPGSVVAGCRIEGEVGRGGMGVVYRATQLSLQRSVALKLIAPELTTAPDFRERFKRESRLAASIEHPNVIPVYEAGEADGVLYLIMRFIEGTDLRALIRSEGRLDTGRATAIVAQVAAALGAAHRRGLIHRDVKPANVLIDSGGGREHAYLTDFGIARDVEATSALTRTGMVVGTLDYIAPELLQDGGADGRSDVYALGCVLFEVLTGQVPFPRDSDVAKMFAHLNEPVPSLREVRPEVPDDLAELARTAMAKDPKERFGTADELAAALAGPVTPPSGTAPAAAPPAPTAPAPAPTEPAPPPTEPAPPVAPPPPTTPRETAPAPQGPAPTAPAPPPDTGPTAPIGPGATPTEPAVTTPLAGRAAPPARRRRTGLIAAAAAVLVAGVVAVVLLAGGGSEEEGGSGGGQTGGGAGGEGSAELSPRALEPVDVGTGADGVAAGEGSVWVANKERNTVARVDPSSRRVQGSTPVGGNPDSLAIGEGGVWVTNTDDDNISLIEPGSARVEKNVLVGDAPEGIAVGKGAVWVANSGDGTVSRVDPESGQARSAQVGSEPIQLAFDSSDVWVTVTGDGTVQKLDAGSGEPVGDPVEVGGSPRGIAFADDLLWVSATESGQIVVIDPSSRKEVDRIDVPDNPREVRAGEGAVWVSCADAHSVVAIDTGERKVAAEVDVEGTPYGLGVGEGRVWAAGLDNGLLTPIEPR
jgi:YVTN family beta-propeller protein